MKKVIILTSWLMMWMISANISEAKLKIDVGNSPKTVVTAVSNFFDNAKKTMDNVGNSAVIKTIGSYVEDAKQMQTIINDAKTTAEQIKEDPLGASIDLAEEKLEEQAQKEQEAEEDGFATNLTEKIEKVQKMTDLEQQQQELLDQINTKREASNKEYQGKIEALKAAQRKATYLVEALGKKLGDVTRIVEEGSSNIFPFAQSNVLSSDASSFDNFRTIKKNYSMLVRFEIID